MARLNRRLGLLPDGKLLERGVSPHILFVDDEAPIRELLALYFRKKGFAVTTAVTAAEARGLIDKNAFDLAVLDVNLAGENGLDLLSYIRNERGPVPVVIFTGLTGDPDLLQKALAAGANGFMKKADPLGVLFHEVCRHLPAGRTGQSAQSGVM